MCVIAISKAGKRQPSKNELKMMWNHNPDGAGYMYARAGEVVIHKGFMKFDDFYRAVRSENFSKEDAVVYHFRISTQAGKKPTMTHPFPLSNDPRKIEALDLIAPVGIAHNGIIRMTSDASETRFSDTAIFIMDYLAGQLFRQQDDIHNPFFQDIIEAVGGWSKFAFLEGDGNIITIGTFTDDNGVLLSNTNHKITVTTTVNNVLDVPKYPRYYAPNGDKSDAYVWTY